MIDPTYYTPGMAMSRRKDRARNTTTVKVNNVLNQTVHQHIFDDLLRRTVLGELKVRL